MAEQDITIPCGKCGLTKARDQFYFDKSRGRHRTRCIACCRSNPSPNSGKRTPGRRAEYRRERGETTAEYVPKAVTLALAAEKRLKHEIALRAKEADHKAHIVLWRLRGQVVGTKEWYARATQPQIDAYLAKCRERYRRRYESNGDAERERQKRFKHANPQKVAEWGDKRRRLAAALDDGTLNRDVVGRLFQSARDCPYCGDALDRKNKSLDHIVPLSRGGAHSVANVLICCKRCNIRKRAMSFDAWLTKIEPKHAQSMRREFAKRFGASPGQDALGLSF